MSSPAPSPEDSHQALQRILSESPSTSLELPNLAPPAWSEGLRRFIESSMKSLEEALSSLFRDHLGLQIFPTAVDSSMRVLLYALLAVGLFLLGAFIYRALVQLPRGSGPGRTPRASSNCSHRDINDLIEEALRKEDIPQATRLVWRGFIAQANLAPTTTPHEYMVAHPEKLPASSTSRLYNLMYSGAAARAEFDPLRKLLTEGARDAGV